MSLLKIFGKKGKNARLTVLDAIRKWVTIVKSDGATYNLDADTKYKLEQYLLGELQGDVEVELQMLVERGTGTSRIGNFTLEEITDLLYEFLRSNGHSKNL